MSEGGVEDWVRGGQERQDKGDLDGAIADFSKALELDPKNLEALFYRGNARLAKNDLDGAISDYDAGLLIAPQEPSLYLNRGAARQDKGDLDGALADFGRSIEFGPLSPRAFRHRGILYHRQLKLELAVADYSRVLEIEPGDALTWTHRGMAKKDLQDFSGALVDCTRALELDPKDPTPWRIRGYVRHQKGDYRGAVDDYTRSLELDGKQPQVSADLAQARQAGGLFCEVCVKESSAGSPWNIQSMGGMGKTFYGDDRPCAHCGSVVRTLWIILFHLPLIPLGSYRVLSRSFTREAVGTREGFSARGVPMAWKQIFGTWMVGLLVVAAFAGGIVWLVKSKKPY